MSALPRFFNRRPAFLVLLSAARDAQRAGRHVLGDRRSGRHVGARADRHRRDELRVAADEDAVLDHRRVLVDPVVVARDRARADVHLLADRRVAEVGQVAGLRPAPEPGLLQLDEVADARARADLGVRARCARTARRSRLPQYASPTIRQWSSTVTSSASAESTMRTPEWMTARAPIVVRPWSDTPGRITVSGPTVTPAST